MEKRGPKRSKPEDHTPHAIVAGIALLYGLAVLSAVFFQERREATIKNIQLY